MNTINELIQDFDKKRNAVPENERRYIVDNLLSNYTSSVKTLSNCINEITKALNALAEKRDRSHLMLWIAAANYHPSLEYVEPLCKLLDYHDVAVPNEQIVELLYDIPSPKAIRSLKKSCLITLPHDNSNEFGVKCLEALAAIDTPDSWAAIETQLESPADRLRECAQQLIDWKKSRKVS